MTDQETEEEPQHWPTERMITEGHAEFATVDDLRGLGEHTLAAIADLCEVGLAAPDECIPCWAYAEIQERKKPKEEDPEDETDTEVREATPEERDAFFEKPYGLRFTDARHGDPVREIERQAGYMQRLVQEILDGPPIPPKDVSLEELATLTLSARNWIRLMDAQGLELSPKQQSLLDEARRIVGRLSQEDV